MKPTRRVARCARVIRAELDQLLAAVDVVGRTGDGAVRHEVDGERGDVGAPDHAPDGQRGAELVTPLLELIAKQLCRQRGASLAGYAGSPTHKEQEFGGSIFNRRNEVKIRPALTTWLCVARALRRPRNTCDSPRIHDCDQR